MAVGFVRSALEKFKRAAIGQEPIDVISGIPQAQRTPRVSRAIAQTRPLIQEAQRLSRQATFPAQLISRFRTGLAKVQERQIAPTFRALEPGATPEERRIGFEAITGFAPFGAVTRAVKPIKVVKLLSSGQAEKLLPVGTVQSVAKAKRFIKRTGIAPEFINILRDRRKALRLPASLSGDETRQILQQSDDEALFLLAKRKALAEERKGFTDLARKLEATDVAPRALVQASQQKPPTQLIPRQITAKPVGVAAITPSEAKRLRIPVSQRPRLEVTAPSKIVKVGEKRLPAPVGLGKAFQTISSTIRKGISTPLSRNPEQLKNIGGFKAGVVDNTRIFEEVYGPRFKDADRMLLKPFDDAKLSRIRMREELANDLDQNIIEGLKIRPKSKESELVQLFGENKINLEALQKRSPIKWKEIIQAEKWFRGRYDRLLDIVNESRKKIYPNNPDKLIPRRDDYFRHFEEFTEGYRDLFKIFSNPADISPQLAGISEFTKPKSKFLSFAQRRLGDTTAVDAVGGYINYLESAAYATHIDPQIAKFRNLAEQLRKTSENLPVDKQINGFIDYLSDFANGLAGKTGTLDRGFIKRFPGGRKTIKALEFLNNRWKANAILGNLSSSLNQLLNVPQGIVSAGPLAATKGLGRVSKSIFTPDTAMAKSGFIKERYAKSAFERFDQSFLRVPKKFARWMTVVLDEVGTKYLWSAEYEKALSKGIKNPIRFADVETRKLVAGRGVGEIPLLQQEQLIKTLAPFTLEVSNAWLVMRDFVKAKQFGKIASLMVVNHLVNKGFERVTGNGVLFDPIEAIMDASEEGLTITQRGGRITGEFLSASPVAALIGGVFPERGIRIGGFETGTREEVFGRQDPTRFGTGLPVASALKDPLFGLLPPFGGRQARKTVDALKALKQQASVSKKGNIRFPVTDKGKALAFGPNSTQVARFYFDNDLKPLGDKDTNVFKSRVKAGEDANQVFFNITVQRMARSQRPPEDKKRILDGLRRLLGIQEVSAVGFTELVAKTSFESAKQDKEKFKKVTELLDSDLAREDIDSQIRSLGVSEEDAQYFDVARLDTDLRTAFAEDIISQMENQPRDQMIEALIPLKRKVGGKQILSSGTQGTINRLFKLDLITREEKKFLSSVEFDKKTGELKIKPTALKAKKKKKLPKITVSRRRITPVRRRITRAARVRVPAITVPRTETRAKLIAKTQTVESFRRLLTAKR